jgi:hypothetical protein
VLYTADDLILRRWRVMEYLQNMFENLKSFVASTVFVFAPGQTKSSLTVDAEEVFARIADNYSSGSSGRSYSGSDSSDGTGSYSGSEYSSDEYSDSDEENDGEHSASVGANGDGSDRTDVHGGLEGTLLPIIEEDEEDDDDDEDGRTDGSRSSKSTGRESSKSSVPRSKGKTSSKKSTKKAASSDQPSDAPEATITNDDKTENRSSKSVTFNLAAPAANVNLSVTPVKISGLPPISAIVTPPAGKSTNSNISGASGISSHSNSSTASGAGGTQAGNAVASPAEDSRSLASTSSHFNREAALTGGKGFNVSFAIDNIAMEEFADAFSANVNHSLQRGSGSPVNTPSIVPHHAPVQFSPTHAAPVSEGGSNSAEKKGQLTIITPDHAVGEAEPSVAVTALTASTTTGLKLAQSVVLPPTANPLTAEALSTLNNAGITLDSQALTTTKAPLQSYVVREKVRDLKLPPVVFTETLQAGSKFRATVNELAAVESASIQLMRLLLVPNSTLNEVRQYCADPKSMKYIKYLKIHTRASTKSNRKLGSNLLFSSGPSKSSRNQSSKNMLMSQSTKQLVVGSASRKGLLDDEDNSSEDSETYEEMAHPAFELIHAKRLAVESSKKGDTSSARPSSTARTESAGAHLNNHGRSHHGHHGHGGELLSDMLENAANEAAAAERLESHHIDEASLFKVLDHEYLKKVSHFIPAQRTLIEPRPCLELIGIIWSRYRRLCNATAGLFPSTRRAST